jgi:hypothetical protein
VRHNLVQSLMSWITSVVILFLGINFSQGQTPTHAPCTINGPQNVCAGGPQEQYSATGGAAPYTWSLEDPGGTGSTIDNTGGLTPGNNATSSQTVTIIAVDSGGTRCIDYSVTVRKGVAITSWDEYQNCPRRVPNPAYPNPVTSPACSNPMPVPSNADNPAGCNHTSFYGACAYHDQCYGTCNRPREECDGNFATFLRNICDEAAFYDGRICQLKCHFWAAAYSAAVSGAGGFGPYQDRQIQACLCCRSN